jgi:hypothetical protein
MAETETSSTNNNFLSGKIIAIGIGILLVVGTVILVLVFTLGGVSSSGCTNPKPVCNSPAELSCKHSAWLCKCDGQTYVESAGGSDVVACNDPATAICSEEGNWSCMCGTASGSADDQQTCETDEKGTYICDVSNNAWNCQCDGTNLVDKSDEHLNCANYSGNYKCVSPNDNGNPSGTSGTRWECTCTNPTTGEDDVIPTCGNNETPDGTNWVCACADPSPKSCVGLATCVNYDGNWNWECKCGAEELDKFIATSQCPARRGNIVCNDGAYECNCVSSIDSNNPVALLDCSDGTGYCDKSGEIQCCLGAGDAQNLSDAFAQAYEETLEELDPDEQVMMEYGVPIYQMISTGDAGERLQEIQNRFVQKLKSKQLPDGWDPDAILEKIQTCTGLTKDAVKTEAQKAICGIWEILSNLEMVELNNSHSLCQDGDDSE